MISMNPGHGICCQAWLRVVDGYLPVPNEPGWGVDLNEEEAVKHPYNEKNFLRLFEEGWETRKPGCYT